MEGGVAADGPEVMMLPVQFGQSCCVLLGEPWVAMDSPGNGVGEAMIESPSGQGTYRMSHTYTYLSKDNMSSLGTSKSKQLYHLRRSDAIAPGGKSYILTSMKTVAVFFGGRSA